MRKIEMQHSDLIVADQEYWVCYIHPKDDCMTLCSLPIDDSDIANTTEPITCPDCLQIIRECQAIDKPYRANFLWPPEEDSIEEAGYEFANGITEEYQKQWWEFLKTRIRECKELDLVPQESTVTFEDSIESRFINVFDGSTLIGDIWFLDDEYVFDLTPNQIITESRAAAITQKLRELNAKKG
jgi:hypothetical protein